MYLLDNLTLSTNDVYCSVHWRLLTTCLRQFVSVYTQSATTTSSGNILCIAPFCHLTSLSRNSQLWFMTFQKHCLSCGNLEWKPGYCTGIPSPLTTQAIFYFSNLSLSTFHSLDLLYRIYVCVFTAPSNKAA